MMRLNKADRSEQVIAFLREQQGLLPIDEADSIHGSAPALPPQGAGPHFTISDESLITFETPENIDEEGNNLSRLSSLRPKIIQLVRDLLANLSQNEQPHLFNAVRSYANEVSKSLRETNFDVLFGEGLFLEEAAVSAKRDLSLRLSPALEDNAETSLNTLLRLHSVFILSSRAGLENLEASERYDRNPELESIRSAALAELADKLGVRSDLASKGVASYLGTLSENSLYESVKRASFKSGTIKNIMVVLAAGASIAALPVTATYLEGPGGGVVATGASYLAMEGLKKSAPFLQVAGLISKQIENLTTAEISQLGEKFANQSFRSYARFVRENEELIRSISNLYGKSNWLSDHLDWMLDISPDVDV